jgi:hypothetical protein
MLRGGTLHRFWLKRWSRFIWRGSQERGQLCHSENTPPEELGETISKNRIIS